MEINPNVTNYKAGISRGSLQEPPKQETITLAPQEILPYFRNFDFFRIFSISAQGAQDLEIRFGDSATATAIVGAGIGYRLPYVTDRIVLHNTSTTTPIEITFITAIGDVTDDRVNFGANSVPVTTPGATSTNSFPDVSVLTTATTSLLPANLSRTQVIITNLDTNTGAVRIGDSGAGATNGIPLPVGGTLILDTSDKIYCYNPNGTTVKIAVTELVNV